MRSVLNILIYFLDCIIPKNNKQFVFSSFPDISDNSYGMFKYIYQLYRNENIKIIWLISNITNINKYKQMIIKEFNLSENDFKKIVFIKKNSINGLFYYIRSKYVFFTHGLYPRVKFPKSHILVNLWHGMPLKTIGYLENPNNKNVPKSSFTIATSTFFQEHISKAFGIKKSNVLVVGQPRNDFLFENNNCLSKFNINKKEYIKIFLWTPTYRQSTIGYTNIDGNVQDGLPIISEKYDVLNTYLETLDSYMIVKLHPMDILNLKQFEKYTNLLFLTNSDLEKQSCQVSQILSEIDVLLTDFSSIYIDFLLLNRPIAFVMDDFDKFSSSRGFVMKNPKDYMPGKFISSKEHFFSFLKTCTEEKDVHQEKRVEVNKIFNNKESNFSENLWTKIIKAEIK